jgi:hypothetical protein
MVSSLSLSYSIFQKLTQFQDIDIVTERKDGSSSTAPSYAS